MGVAIMAERTGLVIRRPRVPDDEITAIIGPPGFLTGCEVSGDLAALAR